jgi:hypothetical protein
VRGAAIQGNSCLSVKWLIAACALKSVLRAFGAEKCQPGDIDAGLPGKRVAG